MWDWQVYGSCCLCAVDVCKWKPVPMCTAATLGHRRNQKTCPFSSMGDPTGNCTIYYIETASGFFKKNWYLMANRSLLFLLPKVFSHQRTLHQSSISKSSQRNSLRMTEYIYKRHPLHQAVTYLIQAIRWESILMFIKKKKKKNRMR